MNKKLLNLKITKYKLLLILFTCIYMNASAQWQQFNLPLDDNEDLFGISFISNSSFYISSYNQLAKTTDNGLTWDISNTLTQPPYLAGGLADLHFYSADEGIITGTFNLTNDEYVLSTKNAGSSWDAVYSNHQSMHFFNALDVYSSNVLICGFVGHIIKSTNSGSSFTNVNSPVVKNLTDIKYITSDRALAVGSGTLLRSFNGGNTWTNDTAYAQFEFSSISVASPGVVYAADYSRILKSIDNGDTFTTINTPFNNISTIAAINASTVLLGTREGIYVSFDGCKSWNKFGDTKDKFVQKIAINNGKAYALCRDKMLLVLDIASMKPQPMAFFTTTMDATCGKTILLSNNQSDQTTTVQWYLNDVLFSSDFNFTQTYTASASVKITLIVKNANGTDTFTTLVGIPYRPAVKADLGPDIYQCYGASMHITNKYPTTAHEWFPSDIYYSISKGQIVTNPIYKDTKIIVKAYDDVDCPAYDTVMIHVGNPVKEFFYPSKLDSTVFICNLDFISDKVGFGLTHGGRFIKTVDGGNTWTTRRMWGDENFFWATLDFIDEKIGYVPVGGLNAKKTTDGGKTFTDIPIVADLVSFINKDTGVFVKLARSLFDNNSVVHKTTDGGKSFKLIYERNTSPIPFYPSNIKMLNADVIYMGGTYHLSSGPGKLMRSLNGGTTWEDIPTPANATPRTISVISADTLFFNDGQFVHRTYDAGKTWYSYLLYLGFGSASYGSIAMVNAKTGYASCAGSVFLTTNGGDCWTSVYTDNTGNWETMTISPSGKSVYYSAATSYYFPPAFVYHRHFYRDLYAWLDSSYCEGSTIKTHNGSFGYTRHQWFLNGVLYSTAFDTSFSLKEGDYTVKLKVDSIGFFPDSLTFKFHVNPNLSSVGSLTGDTLVCSNGILNGGNNKAVYSLAPNPDFTKYNWLSPQSNLLEVPLENGVRVQTVYFAPSDTLILLKAYGISSQGCISPDTASITIRTHGVLPPKPVSFQFDSPSCIQLDSTSFDKNGKPRKFINCTGSIAPHTDYYLIPNHAYSTVPEMKVAIMGNCANEKYTIALVNGNSCGTSPPLEKSYQIYYKPFAIYHTPDTTVAAYGPADLRMQILYDTSSIESCNRFPYSWYLHGNYYASTENLHFDVVSPTDTGVYVARLINGCDSTDIPILLSISGTSGINDTSNEPLLIHPTFFDDVLYLSGPLTQIHKIYVVSVLGSIEKTITTNTATLNLNELESGMYFIIAYTKSGKLLMKTKVLKR